MISFCIYFYYLMILRIFIFLLRFSLFNGTVNSHIFSIFSLKFSIFNGIVNSCELVDQLMRGRKSSVENIVFENDFMKILTSWNNRMQKNFNEWRMNTSYQVNNDKNSNTDSIPNFVTDEINSFFTFFQHKIKFISIIYVIHTNKKRKWSKM